MYMQGMKCSDRGGEGQEEKGWMPILFNKCELGKLGRRGKLNGKGGKKRKIEQQHERNGQGKGIKKRINNGNFGIKKM